MHRLIAAAVAAFSTLALLIATATVGRADPPPGSGEVCVNGVCTVTVTQPGGGGGGGSGGGNGSGGGGGSGGCTWKGKKYPCSDARFGYFSNGCYYKAASPPPAPSDPVWTAVGHKPSDHGAIYNVQCLPLNSRAATSAWFADPLANPLAFPGPPPPPAVTLAQRAEAQLAPTTLTAASNGGASKTTFVNVKTWLWAVGPWAPLTARAAVGTRAVTLVATPVGTRWVMGDGSAPVRCNGPGKPYDAADPNNPPCSYTDAPSIGQPQEGASVNDRFFHVQGSVVYSLHWTCTGNCDEAAGDLPDLPHNTTPMPLRVFEVQTVVRR